MDVRCEHCNTEYEFEDARVPDTGLSVKCSSCGHVFRVFRAGSSFSPTAGGANQDWMVRRQNGNVFSFRELTTLQRWIVERKVTREDTISKTGKQWKRLGDIAELATFFQVVESQQPPPQMSPPQVMQPPAAQQPVMMQPGIPLSIFPPGYAPQPPAAWPQAAMPAQGLTPQMQGVPPGTAPRGTGPQQPAAYPPGAHVPASYPVAGAAWEQNQPQVPAWNQQSGNWQMAGAPAAQPIDPALGDDDDIQIKRGGKGWVIFLLLLFLVGGSAGLAYHFKPAFLRGLMGGAVNDLAVAHVTTGYKELGRDSYAAIDRAADNFRKAISIEAGYAEAHAGLAEAELARAEYIAEEADELSARRATLPEVEQAAVTSQIESKRREASDKSESAFNAARQALQLSPTVPAGMRAMADYYRFKKAVDQMRPLLDQAKAALPKDARLSYVLGSSVLDDATATDRAIRYFDEALELDPALERARYKLARAYFAQGDKAKAQRQLDSLLKDTPEHERAAAMLKELNPPPPPQPATPTPPNPPTGPDKKPLTFEQLVGQADRLRQSDRANKALNLYQKALEIEPDDPDAMSGMGWCYVDMEQADAAIATFKQVLTKAPRFSDAHIGIAEAYRAKGQKRDAIKHYQDYLSIMPNGEDADLARRMLKDLGQ
jgi:predicted Zn finger-like uncharacterized protein